VARCLLLSPAAIRSVRLQPFFSTFGGGSGGSAFVDVAGDLGIAWQVVGVDVVDDESGLTDEFGDAAGEVAAADEPTLNRLDALLPAGDFGVG
jgi:hypothetical protein